MNKPKTLLGFPIKEVDDLPTIEPDSIKFGGPFEDKIVAIGDIVGKTYEPSAVMCLIEKGINEILDRTDGRLKTIKINSSIHARDYDALTIRIVGKL